MNHEILPKLIKELRDTDVPLPLHQQALRSQLLALHADHVARHNRRWASSMERGWILLSSRKSLVVGAIVVVVGAIILSLLALLPASNTSPSQKIIVDTNQTTEQAPTPSNHSAPAQSSQPCQEPTPCRKNAKAKPHPHLPASTPTILSTPPVPGISGSEQPALEPTDQIPTPPATPPVAVPPVRPPASLSHIASILDFPPVPPLQPGQPSKDKKDAKEAEKEQKKDAKDTPPAQDTSADTPKS